MDTKNKPLKELSTPFSKNQKRKFTEMGSNVEEMKSDIKNIKADIEEIKDALGTNKENDRA